MEVKAEGRGGIQRSCSRSWGARQPTWTHENALKEKPLTYLVFPEFVALKRGEYPGPLPVRSFL